MRPFLTALAVVLLVAPAWSSASGSSRVADPSDPRYYTWIEEGVLALGGGGLDEEEVDWLHGEGFRAIASFRREHEDPWDRMEELGIAYAYIPVENAKHMNVTQIETFVSWMREQRDAGRPVYIHCTNGWHRAATMAAAWLMADRGMSYKEAGEHVRDLRGWGVMMRAHQAMYPYEAMLNGEPVLRVTLLAPQKRPEDQATGTMQAAVQVYAGAHPAVGASVRVRSEESDIGIVGATDANGRFEFTYKPPEPGDTLDHIVAYAKLEGWHDGADTVDINYKRPIPTPALLQIDARLVEGGVQVQVTKDGTNATPAHIMAWTADLQRSAFDVSELGASFLRLDHAGQDVFVSADEWGQRGSVVRIPAGTSPLPPGEDPPKPPERGAGRPQDEEPPRPDAKASPQVAATPGPGLALVGAAVALALAWSARRGPRRGV